MYSVNSNDLKTVKFTFVVTDNGIPLDLTDLTVRIAIRKPDKKAVWQDCTVINAPRGEGEVILTNQAYIKKGEYEAELMLYKGADTVAITQKFHYRAAEGIMSDKSLKSETVLGPIDQKLNEVQGTIEELRKNGTGIDAQARADIEKNTAALAEKANQSYIDNKFGQLGSRFTFKGTTTFANLPTTGVEIGDYWYVSDRSTNIAYNGSSFVDIGNNLKIGDKTITEQKTSFISNKSPNLLKFENVPETTINGITYSLQNGILKFNGTATANITINFKLLVEVVLGSYYFNTFSSGNAGQNFSLYFSAPSGAVSGFLTLGANNAATTLSANSSNLQIYIRTGQVFTNYEGKLQLSLSTASGYTKYGIFELSPEISISRSSLPIDIVSPESTNPIHYQGEEVRMFTNGIAIGDSLVEATFNHGANNNSFVSIKKYGYPANFTKMTGVPLNNSGVGGKTSAQWYAQYEANPLAGFDFAIIQLGVNDGLQGVPASESTTAFQNIINKLKAGNKGIKIFIATITPAYADNVTTFEGINTVIKQVTAANSNCYLVDLTRYSECHKGTVYENGHLTAYGYWKVAKEYVSYLSYIISKNQADFKNVQFIGTDYTAG